MRFGKVFGTVGIVIAALFASAQSAHAQAGGQKPDAVTAKSVQQAAQKKGGETKDADKKAGEEDAGPQKPAANKKDGEKDAGSQTPAGIQWTKAIEGILGKLLSWVLVALVFLVLFRAELAALFDRVTQAMSDRGVTLEAGKVKIQISERTQDLYEDRGMRFSVSPFDVEPDPFEGFADAGEVPRQLTFQVSDYVGGRWKLCNPQYATEADQAFELLKEKVGKVARREDVMQELIVFARALEKARFVDAPRLKNLLEGHRIVRDDLITLAKSSPPGADERMVVHAAGVAYMQSGEWSTARSLLEPIAWIDEQPDYLPAADAWLASMYHDRIEAARSPGSTAAPGAFLGEVVSTADDVVSKAEKVAKVMDINATWSPHNVAYYRREVKKMLGIVSAIRADYSELEQSKVHLQRALDAYSQCTLEIAGEGPTPLEHNNLADTYRQCGRFDETQYANAHREIREALAASAKDPTFLNTQALIFIDENKLIEALRVLTSIPQERMAEDNPLDVVQYVDNQILAAKVVSRTDRPKTVRFCHAADILETAARFLDTHAARLGERDVARLKAELNELLGFTYLCLPGYERRSVECFECVARLWDKVSATAEIRWRRRLGGVRAYTWLARASRRDFDYGTAADQRKRGRKLIIDSLPELSVLGLEAGQPKTLRQRNAHVQLDTAMALQGLAEESFHGGEYDDAKKLLDKKDAILAALEDFREYEAIGAKIRLASAHTGLLRGRLAFWCDPGSYEPSVLTNIEQNLLAARGHGPLLDCQVDLALGDAFLAAALAGKGDAAANYRKAINALEFAVGRNAPALRADAMRALVDAYAKRPMVPRHTKESKGA